MPDIGRWLLGRQFDVIVSRAPIHFKIWASEEKGHSPPVWGVISFHILKENGHKVPH